MGHRHVTGQGGSYQHGPHEILTQQLVPQRATLPLQTHKEKALMSEWRAKKPHLKLVPTKVVQNKIARVCPHAAWGIGMQKQPNEVVRVAKIVQQLHLILAETVTHA